MIFSFLCRGLQIALGDYRVKDYRYRPLESRVAYCHRCGLLKQVDDETKVMVTIFHVDKTGIYPFGTCGEHQIAAVRQASLAPTSTGILD